MSEDVTNLTPPVAPLPTKEGQEKLFYSWSQLGGLIQSAEDWNLGGSEVNFE